MIVLKNDHKSKDANDNMKKSKDVTLIINKIDLQKLLEKIQK
jgi:hypothetical protein